MGYNDFVIDTQWADGFNSGKKEKILIRSI
jgi:hypothetical protein